MFYHVIHHPIHTNPNNSSNQTSISVPTSQLMPRYHYSRIVPNTSEVFITENPSNGHSIKSPPPSSTIVTTTSNNNTPGSFTSTFIPFVSNNRTITPTMREYIQIPVNREDGVTVQTNNLTRSVPITYIAETNPLPNLENNNNNIKSTFTNLLRPSSRYFQHHFVNNNTIPEEPTITTPTVSRVPSVTRRLSLSVPVVTSSNNTDNDTTHTRVLVSPVRQIPVRFPQTTTVASTPTTSSRTSSAILRSSPFSHSLQRRRTDLGDISSIAINNSSSQPSSDFNMTPSNILPIRRAEAMAREAIQNMTQQQQQRNSMLAESTNRTSPPPSRRVIINLKNNQSNSLDNHHPAVTKLPPLPYSPRSIQRNNVYHIPVLHELQMPPHPSAIITEPSFQSLAVSNGSYKNELRMEIPVTITTSNDQENEIQSIYIKEEGSNNGERSRSTHNPHQTLKSILKRSSSRDSVSRKNVSFMNA